MSIKIYLLFYSFYTDNDYQIILTLNELHLIDLNNKITTKY